MDRTRARLLAKQYLADGRPTDWFEVLYAEAERGASVVPWADLRPNPNLVTWLDRQNHAFRGRALKIGCGYGDDAEELAQLGFDVVAFDISPTAIKHCWQRFPNSVVNYVTQDVLKCPSEWTHAFDFVLESYTLQVLPPAERSLARQQIADFVAKGGTLLVIARGRNADDDPGLMPWPLLEDEVRQFEASGLQLVNFEDYLDNETPPVRRFRAEFRR